MKQQISRLSPHQNAKVAAVLMAVTSLILLVPLFLLGSVFGANQAPIWMIIIFPVIYLVVGYIFTVIACALYNVIVPMTGGIEYEATGAAASTS
jgi:hypothetical protein